MNWHAATIDNIHHTILYTAHASHFRAIYVLESLEESDLKL